MKRRFYISEEQMYGGACRVSERNPETRRYEDVQIYAETAEEAKRIFCETRGVDEESAWLYKAYDADKADVAKAEGDAFLKEHGYKSWEAYDRDWESAHPSRPIEL